MLNLKKIL